MRRKFGFKPSLRQTLTANAAYLGAMSPGGVLPADLQASLDRTMPPAPKSRKRREVLAGVDIDSIHGARGIAPVLEGEVIRAVSQLLAVHPKILFACRQNSGQASYEAKTGVYAPVAFYRLLRKPEDMTIVDFWGLLSDGRMYALEAKRENWKAPTVDREHRQDAFLEMVRSIGGIGAFVRSADEAKAAIEG